MAAQIIPPGTAAAQYTDLFMGLVRMPLFALLAGTLILTSVERRGAGSVAVRRTELIGYQFLLWTIIQGGSELATNPVKNVPITWQSALDITHPLAHLWFLPFILLASLITAFSKPWQSPLRGGLTITATAALSILTWGQLPKVIFVAGLPLIVFVVVGASIGAERASRILTGARLSALMTVGCAGMLILTAIMAWGNPAAPTEAYATGALSQAAVSMAGTAAGITGFSTLIAVACRTLPSLERALAYLGTRSIHIYLPHILFTAATRIALSLVGISSPAAHLIIGTLVGVEGPLLLYWFASRWTPWLYAPPWRPEGTLPRTKYGG